MEEDKVEPTVAPNVNIEAAHTGDKVEAKTSQGQDLVLSDDAHEKYVNFAMCRHSNADFILLFGASNPLMENRVNVNTVLRLTPESAKSISRALSSSVDKYEKKYGTIKG